tara:strand:+ start:39 stop:410 length:372 start_codon:yes stop_codon:yes gene_type:complete
MTKDKAKFIQRVRKEIHRKYGTVCDIEDAPYILRHEEAKETYGEWGALDREIKTKIREIQASKPEYSPKVSTRRHNLMIQARRERLGIPEQIPSFWYLIWGSGVMHSLGYLALLGIGIIWLID